MSRLTTVGNLAILEYDDSINNPSWFEIDKDGVLFIEANNIQIAGRTIGAAKRLETGLKNYTIIGSYDYAKGVIKGESIESVIDEGNINRDRCLVLLKTKPVELI